MRQSSRLLCLLCFAAGVFSAEGTAAALLTPALYIAPDRAEITAAWTNNDSIPGSVTLEGKADGLPRIRSPSYGMRQNAFAINEQLRDVRSAIAEELRAIAKETTPGFVPRVEETVHSASNPQGRIAVNVKERLRALRDEFESMRAFATSA